MLYYFGFDHNNFPIFREQRPLFKICLLSLALSDIIFVTGTGVTYISQLSNEYTSLWRLGETSCTILPFIQTMAILANSMTLVAIAVDRYLAMVRLTKGLWDPGCLFCFICVLVIWGLSSGIASPMLTLYHVFEIIVLIPDPSKPASILDFFQAKVCISDKTKNSFYYGIVFAIIFLPLLITFFWLNVIIAKEIWVRRKPVKSCSTTSHVHKESVKGETKNRRKQRNLRMFKTVVLIMLVFFVCRLPGWIFLLVKLNKSANESVYWLMHYGFGILSMFNCVLNPLIYTFLCETMQFIQMIKNLFKILIVNPILRLFSIIKNFFMSCWRRVTRRGKFCSEACDNESSQ